VGTELKKVSNVNANGSQNPKHGFPKNSYHGLKGKLFMVQFLDFSLRAILKFVSPHFLL
jgi:hypothetical protein